MVLSVYGRTANNVFALSGLGENSATYALGWTLDQSPTFLRLFLYEVVGWNTDLQDLELCLQRHDGVAGGYTDIEFRVPDKLHIIVEAKRGWTLPSSRQLEAYARRISSPSGAKLIVTLSAANSEYAKGRLPKRCGNVLVRHLSWSEVRQLAIQARGDTTRIEEKLWLKHLSVHLEGYMQGQDRRDNRVYVVSLSRNPIQTSSAYTWIDVVEQDGRYFHPVGNHWPVIPPTYIGFRYGGRLQSVHHIDDFKVVGDLSRENAHWPPSDSDHFVYSLGPAMKPAAEMRAGNIYRGHRVHCAIDTLLSGAFSTISDARDETNRRYGG